MKNRLIYICISLFSIMMFLSPIKVYAQGITLDKSKITLGVGYPEQLTYTLGDNLNKDDITWISSNPSVATVHNGKVIAISEGRTIITASIDGIKSTCEVIVVSSYVSVTGLKINKSSITLLSGNTEQLTATITPSNASNQNISWSSSNNSVATVSSSGKITAKGPGTATITASISGITAECKVTVTYSMSLKGISLNKTSLTIKEKETSQLSVIYNPSNATNQKVTWKSSNEGVVSVSSTGLVTAKSKGSATITVISNDGGYTASCKVIVEEISKKVTGIELDKKELSIIAGEQAELKATVIPDFAENKKVKWSSSDEKIATVENGKITAKFPGTAEIKVKTEDGNKEAICKVTVTSPPIESISFKDKEKTIVLNEEVELELISVPENSFIENPIWSSSDEKIVTVENGKIKGLSLGEATVNISNKEGTISASIKVKVIEKPKEPLNITIEGYDLKFNPTIKNYSLAIGNHKELKISSNVNEEDITIKGNQNLKNGSIITITINDTTKTTYVINIKKKQNYTIYFIAAISVLLLFNLIRILIKQKRKPKL